MALNKPPSTSAQEAKQEALRVSHKRHTGVLCTACCPSQGSSMHSQSRAQVCQANMGHLLVFPDVRSLLSGARDEGLGVWTQHAVWACKVSRPWVQAADVCRLLRLEQVSALLSEAITAGSGARLLHRSLRPSSTARRVRSRVTGTC